MDVVAMLVLVGVVGAIILTPLFRRSGVVSFEGTAAAQGQAGRRAEAVLADLEFDHATGKLADDDYAALRARLETAAAAPGAPVVSAAPVAAAADEVIDSLEAEIRAARARRFCTGCGTTLPKTARFCPACGTPVEGRA